MPSVASVNPLAGASQPWIQSARWDAWWIFSGLWAPMLMVLVMGLQADDWRELASGGSSMHDHRGFALLFTALGLFHRLTSIYAVLASPILRDEIRSDPRRYLWLPAAILAGSLLLAQAFVFHPVFAFVGSAYGQMWAFFVLAYVMILWERWHFCMQEFGVLSLYRARSEQFSRADRRFDRVYVVALMLVVNMVLYVCHGFSDERHVLLAGTWFSDLQGPIFEPLAGAAFAVGMLGLVVAVGRESRHPRRSLPKLLFYVLVGVHTLVLYWLPQALGLFFLSYVFHHWMVAVGLFNRIMLNSQPQATSRGRAAALLRKVGLVFALCLVMHLFFAPLNKAANLSPVPDTLWFSGSSLMARLFSGMAIGAFFAFNFLHYYYDRCLYSFAKLGVRKAVMPLLLGPALPGQRVGRMDSLGAVREPER